MYFDGRECQRYVEYTAISTLCTIFCPHLGYAPRFAVQSAFNIVSLFPNLLNVYVYSSQNSPNTLCMNQVCHELQFRRPEHFCDIIDQKDKNC
jgi:hypothetical protein